MTSEQFPLSSIGTLHHNESPIRLIEAAVRRGEVHLASTGALVANTGEHTGRSVKDKFTVRDSLTQGKVWWDNNNAMTPEHFEVLRDDFLAHAKSRDVFVQDLHVGADPAYRYNTRVLCENAWHAAFIHYLLRRSSEAMCTDYKPELTIASFPSFRADPKRHGCRSSTIIAIDFARNLVLIGGTSYAGEIKKSVFTFMNWAMPFRGVLPMHCSANYGNLGDTALFFGLSGTGKTTLSADPKRMLVGDDEHGWSSNGVFNFEGGCYAKCIRLRKESEPEIWAATNRFGAVLENVVLKGSAAEPDYSDESLTENTRSAYPCEWIPHTDFSGRAPHPKNIIFLTADAFGVMPPIAKLTPSQAMYHFLSGYTAKVAGTEKGLGNEPETTFSACFGRPFLPLHPGVYGNLLRDLIAKHKVDCWLVNTGWTGGKFGVGQRMPIKATRSLLDAALSGTLKKAPMRADPNFQFQVPTSIAGIDSKLLNPKETWPDASAYEETARRLVDSFRKNFEPFSKHVDEDVRKAAP